MFMVYLIGIPAVIVATKILDSQKDQLAEVYNSFFRRIGNFFDEHGGEK